MEERKVAKLKVAEDGTIPAASSSIAAPASSRLTDTTASFLGGLTDIDVTMSEGTRQLFLSAT